MNKTVRILVSSADNLCKQFGPRSGRMFCIKLFDTLMVFLKNKNIFNKVDFEKHQQTTRKHSKFTSRQIVESLIMLLPCINGSFIEHSSSCNIVLISKIFQHMRTADNKSQSGGMFLGAFLCRERINKI